jgi:hypothetical protein
METNLFYVGHTYSDINELSKKIIMQSVFTV